MLYASQIPSSFSNIMELCPHGECAALAALWTGLCSAFKARDRGKITLGQAENFTNLVFIGLARQTITAALALNALNDVILRQHGQDALQIFERDLLSFGNFFIAI